MCLGVFSTHTPPCFLAWKDASRSFENPLLETRNKNSRRTPGRRKRNNRDSFSIACNLGALANTLRVADVPECPHPTRNKGPGTWNPFSKTARANSAPVSEIMPRRPLRTCRVPVNRRRTLRFTVSYLRISIGESQRSESGRPLRSTASGDSNGRSEGNRSSA